MKNSTVKVSYSPYLRDKTPEQWARLIRRCIKPVQLRAWVASILMANYPSSKGWSSPLTDLADEYDARLNRHLSADLEGALVSIGLPYFRSTNDDEEPAWFKRELSQQARDVDKLNDITRMYNGGMSVLSIAQSYSSSCQSIGQLLRRHGVIGGYAEAARKAG